MDTKRHDEPFGRMLTVSGMAVLVLVWLITRADEGAVIVLACASRGREDYYGGGGRGTLYTYRYNVTTRMIPALRWAAMRAILMFQ